MGGFPVGAGIVRRRRTKQLTLPGWMSPAYPSSWIQDTASGARPGPSCFT